jgi:hypothetical protein
MQLNIKWPTFFLQIEIFANDLVLPIIYQFVVTL